MSKLKSLSDLIKENGLTEYDLNKPMTFKHCNKIAIRIGEDWERLATYIEIDTVEVDHIKEEHCRAKDRRLALLREWKRKFGNDATYAKMIQSLEEIGNRELTEFLLSLLKKERNRKELSPNIALKSRKKKQHHHNYDWKSKIVVVLVLLISCITLYSLLKNVPTALQNLWTPNTQSKSSAIVPQSPKVHNSRNCSQPVGYDLPVLHSLFVGRQEDIEEVVSKTMKSNILNIMVHQDLESQQ